ncbi:Dipeptide and tripeptide permease A [Poriferisphaera corsica]|uniref:Dipeptide and tripeptide permease A n=1 Tax=Poriferisphaera corsica TaxID=2528020 RepID=A0A517YTJ8_9BACT|nr:oligopeptide:H+ symporter [Poriferisphaera corsica]QDU33547.1 Dipeptide and tripeptide permease A [Poriferisphaera corsica]
MSEVNPPEIPHIEIRKTWFGHPRGLSVLFFAEMWERFSYYGMRALLVLYLTQHFLFSDIQAQGIYAAYASLVYLTPLIGGFIADRYLGSRKAVLIGAIFLTLGHFLMVFEGEGSSQFLDYNNQQYEVQSEGRGETRRLFAIDQNDNRLPLTFSAEGAHIGSRAEADSTLLPAGQYTSFTQTQPMYQTFLFFALSLIIVGVGFLKANISTIVGDLYDKDDDRRDSGFTIFYMGINLGSLLSTILCGWLGIVYGWKYGFGLAGFGMLTGLITFMIGMPLLEGRGEPPRQLRPRWEMLTWIGGTIFLLPLWWLIQNDHVVVTSLAYIAPGMFLFMLGYSILALKGKTRSRMIVAIVLMIFSVLFWVLFEQAGSSLSLYAARNSELTIIPDLLTITSAQTQFFNPALIVLLAPFFAWIWQAMSHRGIEPSTPVKFSWALIQVGLGFLVLVFGAKFFATETQTEDGIRILVPLIWLFFAYLLHTTGEICLSPVGLSRAEDRRGEIFCRLSIKRRTL